MDTRLNIRQCLMGMTFLVILHHCDVASASGSLLMCPQGQLYHTANIKLGRPYATCCFPTSCGVGQEVRPCTINGTEDKCHTCSKHYNQSQRTSSFTMNKKCVSWPLNENCEIDATGKYDFSDPRTHRCLCNLERGQRFDMPEIFKDAPAAAFCQPFKSKCEPGTEPTLNGSCRPCEYGHFKKTRGYRLCEPKQECDQLGLTTLSFGGSTADNNCSEPAILTTPKPTIKQVIVDPGDTGGGGGGGGKLPGGGGQNPPPPLSTVSKTTAKPTTTPLTRSGSSRSVKETGDSEEGDSLLPVILAVILVLAVIVIIVTILLYRKHKGMSFCCAAFKSSDVEKNPGITAGHSQYKNGTGNGILNEPHITVVTKGSVNNNINGTLPQHSSYMQNSNNHRHNPHAQHNGNSVHFSDSSDLDSQMYQNQANSSHQNRMSPAPRHGILRNGRSASTSDPHPTSYPTFRHSRSQEASIDSIGREKLRVNGFEANQDLGENDPLLVAEGPVPRSVAVSGGSAGHNLLHNSVFAASNSPPMNMSPLTPGIYTSASGGHPGHPPNMQTPPLIANINTNFNMATSSSPSTIPIQTSQSQQPAHQVTFGPAVDTATFKRSISVIASPEGEVEEEELEANVPRFSQILPDGSEEPASSVNEPANTTTHNPILRMLQEKEREGIQQQQQTHPMDSPQREMTHQMRLPSERLQHRPYHQNPASNTTQQRNPNYAHHPNNHRGYPPALLRASSQPTDNNIPDHCIMDLKEQQLANSFHSSLEDSNSGMRSDLSTTGVLKLEDFTASQDQTNLKVCPVDSANKNGAKSSKNNSKVPEFGMFVIGSGYGSAQNTLERKRSGGSNSLQRRRFLSGSGRQNSVERKRRSSGSESSHNTLEFKRGGGGGGGGEKQRSCVKFSGNGLEEGETEEKKLCLGRTVSFDSEEKNSNSSMDYLGHETKPKQVGGNSLTSTSSSSDGSSQGPYFDVGKEQQPSQPSVEGGYEGENESDDEDNTDPKQRQPEENLDLSSSEDGETSPVTNTYRRCQSESSSSTTEAVQKPPPRSLSEESKPLKMERPIAKVKPMPASDLSVNKLVPDEEGGSSSPPATGTTPTPHNGASGNILDYSSDSSSGEENVSNESRRHEENRQEDSDSADEDGRQ